MKNIQEIISDQQKLNQERQSNSNKSQEKNSTVRWVMGLYNSAIDKLTKSLYKVELSNKNELESLIRGVEKAIVSRPTTKIPEQIDTRTHLETIVKELQKLDLVVNVPEVKIPDNKKELLSIERAVKDIKFPEMPEPQTIDFSVLKNELEKINKALTAPSTKEENKSDKELKLILKNVVEKLNTLNESVLSKDIIIPETDLSKVVEATKATTKAINSLVFPVANFNAQGIIDAVNDMSVNIGDIEIQTEGLAQETTLQSVAAQLTEPGTNDTVASNIAIIATNTSSLVTDAVTGIVDTTATRINPATEETLGDARDKLDTGNGKLDLIYQTQSDGTQKTQVVGAGNSNIDFATETTQLLGNADISLIEQKVSTYAEQQTQTQYLQDIELKISTAENQSPLDKYILYATEYGTTYNYICKEDKDGNWYIQRETISTGIRDYATGTADVATAWTGRAGQTYGLFSDNF